MTENNQNNLLNEEELDQVVGGKVDKPPQAHLVGKPDQDNLVVKPNKDNVVVKPRRPVFDLP